MDYNKIRSNILTDGLKRLRQSFEKNYLYAKRAGIERAAVVMDYVVALENRVAELEEEKREEAEAYEDRIEELEQSDNDYNFLLLEENAELEKLNGDMRHMLYVNGLLK